MREVVAALVAASVLAACGGGSDAAPAEFTGRVLDNPFQVSATPLVDPSGAPYSLVDDTDARLTLLFFGYTHCPDICGQVMATLAGTMARLDDQDREQVDVVFVTTDPARDTAEVVGDYATDFDDSFLGLTGDLDDIVSVARTVGVGVEKGDELPGGGYDITHGTQVMAIDESDQVPVFWGQDVSQAQLAADLHRLLEEE